MDVTPLIPKGHQRIDSYGGGGFKVTDAHYQGSVLVFPDATQGWSVSDIDACEVADFAPILALSPLPEIVVVGCGTDFRLLPKALRTAFRERGIPVEAMDTGAACRTYNILLTEGRRVAAALIAV